MVLNIHIRPTELFKMEGTEAGAQQLFSKLCAMTNPTNGVLRLRKEKLLLRSAHLSPFYFTVVDGE